MESGADSRYGGLPRTAGVVEPGRWNLSLQTGYSDTGNPLMGLRGPILAAGLARGVRGHWAIEALFFADRLEVEGDGGREDLHPLIQGVGLPLDLPQEAEFTEPGGRLVHRGAGLGVVRQSPTGDPRRFWTLHGGVLLEEYDARDFATRFQLVGGVPMPVSPE